jgi:uncharacterized protein YfaP (DUF2135 family)
VQTVGQLQQEIHLLENIRDTELQGQSGKLRINLAWNTTDDLDLHVVTPNGEIFYSNKKVEHNGIIGQLDVDKNAGNDIVSNPQENVNFDGMPVGLHKIYVHFYTLREKEDVPFILTIISENGDCRIFSKTIKGKGSSVNVIAFEYKNGIIQYIDI